MKKIAILTSGGDAPGMNAAIRAVTLCAIQSGFKCLGVIGGYSGLIENEVQHLGVRDVSTIVRKGGTILKSGRCPSFSEPESAMLAAETLCKHEIDALVVIGGDGSVRGMIHLGNYWKGQIIGLPGTIDNDLAGTDETIGFNTATQTAVEAIDKIRDTADSFDRIFLVELMGRNSGYLAMSAGISCGTEQILVPEHKPEADLIIDDIVDKVKSAQRRRIDGSYIISVAEHYWPEGTTDLAKQITDRLGVECRVCILGHIQRGGRPVWQDRLLATRLGMGAIEAIKDGQNQVMIGEIRGELVFCPALTATTEKKPLETSLSRTQKSVFE